MAPVAESGPVPVLCQCRASELLSFPLFFRLAVGRGARAAAATEEAEGREEGGAGAEAGEDEGEEGAPEQDDGDRLLATVLGLAGAGYLSKACARFTLRTRWPRRAFFTRRSLAAA